MMQTIQGLSLFLGEKNDSLDQVLKTAVSTAVRCTSPRLLEAGRISVPLLPAGAPTEASTSLPGRGLGTQQDGLPEGSLW